MPTILLTPSCCSYETFSVFDAQFLTGLKWSRVLIVCTFLIIIKKIKKNLIALISCTDFAESVQQQKKKKKKRKVYRDRQTYRQRQTDRQSQANRHRQADRQKDRQAGKQRERQAGRQAEKQTTAAFV